MWASLLSGFSKPQFTTINFEDVQNAIKSPYQYTIIHTLSVNEEFCLIMGTLPAAEEEERFNGWLERFETDKKIIVYGKYAHEPKSLERVRQLKNLGFQHVYLYGGGLFEWMLLQDIYGSKEFPTTRRELDLLKFKGPRGLV